MPKTFFQNANLLDGVNPPIPGTTVILEGNRIVEIGTGKKKVSVPTDKDQVFDLDGKTLMPGMAFCHFHVAYDNVASGQEIDLKHSPTMLTLVAAKNAELLFFFCISSK